ncbi:hypothetical protein KY289_024589 [Solanum tuberosum]|nr:hypothetical protein KY289_024589 [Solanum tuberosum]
MIAWSSRFSRSRGSDIKKGLGWQVITYRRTYMLCGKRSTSPRGPDLVKDQEELEAFFNAVNEIFWG